MEFITDRTEADVLLNNAKGSYGHTDLNRVEAAVKDISERLGLNLATKTDWGYPGDYDPGKWPVEAQMARYLGNIFTVRDHFGLTEIPLPTSMNRLTWQGANNIEKMLQRTLVIIDGIQESYRYSGEFYAGEEISL